MFLHGSLISTGTKCLASCFLNYFYQCYYFLFFLSFSSFSTQDHYARSSSIFVGLVWNRWFYFSRVARSVVAGDTWPWINHFPPIALRALSSRFALVFQKSFSLFYLFFKPLKISLKFRLRLSSAILTEPAFRVIPNARTKSPRSPRQRGGWSSGEWNFEYQKSGIDRSLPLPFLGV